ncbi:MAG: hypothetical protein JRG89_21005 [Deltaproteobacteria bacterium]|nr:hypothetical protein [Deltaproteobacteria bacterium]MBW2390888.1 hypothetical protein [Deltaproteobacteria bacterium]MBW2726902.1 hypothetical protein [Deltaproteobacteria bacterium]
MDSESAVGTESRSREADARTLSPVALGTLTLAAFLLYFWLSGTLFPGDAPGFWMPSPRATGAALTYSAIPAFLLAALRYANRQTSVVVDELVVSGSLTREAVTDAGGAIGALGLKQNVQATIAGLILGSFNVPWAPIANHLATRSPTMFTALSFAVGNLVVWVVVVHVVIRRVDASNSLRRLGRDHAEVDLFRLDALLPFGRIGTQGVLIVAIAVSLASFQSLDAEIRWVNYSWAFGAGIPAGLALLLIPMIGIRQNIREVKRRELARLDEAIVAADRDLDPDPLRYLGDLLHRRETVVHLREWPLDMTALSRVAIYFIIPPIAWVGGAVVEIVIQAAIGN